MRKLLINLILIIGLIAALAACGPKQPANHLDAIKAAGVIKVGTSADYPPFEYIDQAGNLAGFDVELMQELAKKLVLARRRVPRETDPRARVVPHVAVDHRLDVDGRAERIRDVVDAPVFLRARIVP